MKTNLYILGSIFLLCIATSSCEQKKEEAPASISIVAQKINQILEEEANAFLQDSMLTAVSIGIYAHNEHITSHYGELDPGQGNRPSDRTYYEIASVSKTFAGALVAQAELEGKLSLEDDIRKYLKEAYPNFEFDGHPIRIKHLLLHQAGFPQFLPTSIGELFTEINDDLPFKVHAIESAYTKELFLEDLHKLQLTVAPGESYGYSNVDVELMAHILENIYQMSYDDLLRLKITSVAGLDQTKIRLSDEEKENLANGYGINRRLTPHIPNALWGADGGMKSTTPDMVKYMTFLLDSNNAMVRKSQETLLDLGDYGAGYFWPIRNSEEDGTYFNHHGGAYGTQNWLYIYPKHKIGISVITNQSDLETAGKLQNLLQRIFEKIKTIESV